MIDYKDIKIVKVIEDLLNSQKENVNSGDGGPFAAAILNSSTNEVICVENNNVIEGKDPTAHAEVQAIRKACEKLNRYSLENYYLISTSEPCPMCYAAIRWARLDAFYFIVNAQVAANFGFDDTNFQKEMGDIYNPNDDSIKRQLYLRSFLGSSNTSNYVVERVIRNFSQYSKNNNLIY